MDFHILQAPHDVPEEPPKVLVEKGFPLPFKSWLKIGEWRTNQETGEEERHSPNIVYGVEDSIKLILEEIKTHGPFDGVLSFS